MRDQYRVIRSEQGWTIGFDGQDFDVFPTQEDAIARAIEWARNASAQGHEVEVLVEGDDGEHWVTWSSQGS